MSAAPESNDRQTEILRRQEEIKRQLEELRELEEAKVADERAAETKAALTPPEPVDPATLPPEEREKLEQLREIEERGIEKLDRQYPVAWNPLKSSEHPNPIKAALILRIDPNVGPSPTYGTYSAVLEIRDGQGREWSVWCPKPSSKLWNTLLRLRLQPGEVVALRDNGMRPSKFDPARKVHDVDLVRVGDDTGPEPIDYDKLERAPEAPAEPEPQAAAEPDDDIPF